jgi:UDP:flavonoid glycosyltransferase YjiC (YdhE family)
LEHFMHALLVSAGSAGNMLPFVGLGAALKARGHDVTMIGSGAGTGAIRSLGLGLAELDGPEEGRKLAESDPAAVRKAGFLGSLVPRAVRYMRRVYELIAQRYVPGETVIVAQGWLFGARIAQEKLGVPLATVNLQPLLFGSAYDIPGLPRWVPRCVPRLANSVVERAVDWGLASAIDGFRRELGLRPACRPVMRWWRSPELVIGFFPEWYSAPQPDWTGPTLLGGFPLFDAPGSAVPPELDDFLAEGEPPLVFSQAWLVHDAQDYFTTCVEVAQRLGRRAVLLTSHPEQLPRSLPPGVRHFGFVPLSRLLPRAAAIVHHGGMGTIGQSLAAGVPQLTVPVMLDQFDNSRRLLRLGVSANLRSSAYTLDRVSRVLRDLLESPAVAERCRHFSQRCRQEHAFATVCQALEQLHGRLDRRPLAPRAGTSARGASGLRSESS